MAILVSIFMAQDTKGRRTSITTQIWDWLLCSRQLFHGLPSQTGIAGKAPNSLPWGPGSPSPWMPFPHLCKRKGSSTELYTWTGVRWTQRNLSPMGRRHFEVFTSSQQLVLSHLSQVHTALCLKVGASSTGHWALSAHKACLFHDNQCNH